MDLTQSINEYLQKHGLTPSRTYFVLQTERYFELDNDDFNLENSCFDQTLETFSQTKICTVCGRTYMYQCLPCEQDKQFQESLRIDQEKGSIALDGNDRAAANDDELFSDNEQRPDDRPDQNTLRKLRINALTKQQQESSLSEEIKRLSQEFLCMNVNKCVTFNVRRRHIFSDTIRKLKIFFSETPLSKFKVEFTSVGTKESAVDTGGPGRELVTLFYRSVTGQLLHGAVKNEVFVHDLLKVGSGDYYCFGQFVALALLHGYDTPHQLSKGLSGYITGAEACYCTISDVPDVDLREKLVEVSNCSNEAEFNQCMTDFNERYDLGYTKFKPSFDEKEKLLKTIAHHCIISSKLEEIQKFMNGLSCGGVLDVLRKFPEESMKLFLYECVSSEDVKGLFSAVHSNEDQKIEIEEDILYNLHNFIDEVGFGKVKSMVYIDLVDLEDGINERWSEKSISLEDFLVFLTGSKYLPTSKIELLFDHDFLENERVKVNTCQFKINFPASRRYAGEFFSQNIIEDILNSPGFGKV